MCVNLHGCVCVCVSVCKGVKGVCLVCITGLYMMTCQSMHCHTFSVIPYVTDNAVNSTTCSTRFNQAVDLTELFVKSSVSNVHFTSEKRTSGIIDGA